MSCQGRGEQRRRQPGQPWAPAAATRAHTRAAGSRQAQHLGEAMGTVHLWGCLQSTQRATGCVLLPGLCIRFDNSHQALHNCGTLVVGGRERGRRGPLPVQCQNCHDLSCHLLACRRCGHCTSWHLRSWQLLVEPWKQHPCSLCHHGSPLKPRVWEIRYRRPQQEDGIRTNEDRED